MNAKKDMYVVTCKHQMHTKINEFACYPIPVRYK